MGYYQASDRVTEAVLQPVGERVASKVKEEFADAVAIVVRVFFFDGGQDVNADGRMYAYVCSG